MIISDINFELIKKYDTSGPRYTSYPTAHQFTDQFSASDLQEEIQRTNRSIPTPPLSLYFHLPFCESVCFFCGCNVTFTSDRKRPAPYTEWIIQEMDQVVPLLDSNRKVVQLHWGGGTPTFFPPEQLHLLHQAIQKRFSFDPQAEIGLEVDPRETTTAHLETLQSLGFNRLSMGIQDFDPQVQRSVNRIQPFEVTRRVIHEARQRGFKSISVDLIYGLPFQTESSFARTLDQIVALDPDRMAVFNFAFLPEIIRHQKAIPRDALPSPDEKIRLLKQAIQTFCDAGYRYIGMDHFAKPADELCKAQDEGTLYRNFQGYTTHAGCDLYAFGVSAISQIGNTLSQNQKNIHDYEKKIVSKQWVTQRGIRLHRDDLIRREVIMKLLCEFQLNFSKINQKHSIDFEKYFENSLVQLQPMAEDGLLEIQKQGIKVSASGRLLIRNICMCFDAYLGMKPAPFSRTV